MAANAATRKPAVRKAPDKPRETAAQKRARLAEQAATLALSRSAAGLPPEPEFITPIVARIPDAPEVPGGAATLTPKSTTVERDTLFYFNSAGYTIPKTFAKIDTLAYAHVAREQGMSAAYDWAMERALGSVGYSVLLASGVDDATLDRMLALVIARIEGLTDPK